MKKDIKAWAVKLNRRSFYRDAEGRPHLYSLKSEATHVAIKLCLDGYGITEAIRVRVRIEEIT
jgi:hypothetical protein